MNELSRFEHHHTCPARVVEGDDTAIGVNLARCNCHLSLEKAGQHVKRVFAMDVPTLFVPDGPLFKQRVDGAIEAVPAVQVRPRQSKHTPPKPLALFDLDGTCVDYDGAMRVALTALCAPGEQPRLTAEDEERHSYIRARRQLIKDQPEWWFNLQPLARGMRLYHLLVMMGFRVVVLTRGPKHCPEAWSQKYRWCRKHLPSAAVTVTSDEKSRVYGRVLVDDFPDYVTPWLDRRPRGLVIMPDQPWNQGFTHPQVIRHVENDDEVAEALHRQAHRRIPADEEDE